MLSRRLAQHLLRDAEWHTDPAHAGADLWVITKALTYEVKLAQVFLGPRPVPQVQPPSVPDALATIVGKVFLEMERYAHHWQRIRGSLPVPTFGDERPPPDTAPAPAPGPLVEAFELGWRDLRTLWSTLLPPQTLLALQRIPREAGSFRMPDHVWARIVYDFAVGFRFKAMDRLQLLRSMTPIYLGWVASFVNEVAPLDAAAADARVERLCAAFEAEKSYLIARWRWPDRFNP
jgi:hypothetical protein